MPPIAPCEDGELTMIRTVFIRMPYASATAGSSVWMTALWPWPWKATMSAARSNPRRSSSARSTARTGQSFSRVSGSSGPTRSASTRMTEVSAGTENPARSAIHAGLCPTAAALTFGSQPAPEPPVAGKRTTPASPSPEGVARWACRERNSVIAAS